MVDNAHHPGDRRLRRRSTGHTPLDTRTPDTPDHRSLQSTAGNQAATALYEGAQAKLTVGAVDDPLEHEADTVANQVVATLTHDAHGSHDAHAATSSVQRSPRRRVQRRRPATDPRTAGGDDGGPVDPATDRAIRSRSGGQPLQRSARAPLEAAFGGADFSGVRTHSGPEAAALNDHVGAEAFTVGSDIFFRGPVPATTDPLLAHELTHVIQQGHATTDTVRRWNPGTTTGQRGRSKAITSRSGAAAAAGGAAAAAKSGSAGSGAGSGGPSGTSASFGVTPFTPQASQFAYSGAGKVIDTRSSNAAAKPMSTLKVRMDETQLRYGLRQRQGKVRPAYAEVVEGRGENNYDLTGLWVAIRPEATPTKQVLAEAEQAQGKDKRKRRGKTFDDTLKGLDTGPKAHDILGGVSKDLGKEIKGGADHLKGTQSSVDAAGGIGSTAYSFLTLATSIREMQKADNAADFAEGYLNFSGGMAGAASGITNTVQAFGGETGGTKDALAVLGGVTGLLDSIKAGYKGVRKTVELIQKRNEMSRQEKATGAFEVISSGIETVKGSLETVSTFMEYVEKGSAGVLSTVIPGLSIAIAAAKLIIRGVDFAYAWHFAVSMRDLKRGHKSAIGGIRGKTSVEQAKKIIQDVEDKVAIGLEPLTDADKARYDAAQEYLLSKGIQYINNKRMSRAGQEMATALAKASGDIASLGGVSAGAGQGIKAAAAGVELGFFAARTTKQAGRDKRARWEEKHKDDGAEVPWYLEVFDASRSTQAKQAEYAAFVDRIYSMVLVADQLPAPAQDEKDTRFDTVHKYIRATGLSYAKWRSMASDPAKLKKEMIKAMGKR